MKPRGRGSIFGKVYERGDIRERILPDGDMQAYYKGKPIDYDKDYIDLLEERAHRISQGKDPAPISNIRKG